MHHKLQLSLGAHAWTIQRLQLFIVQAAHILNATQTVPVYSSRYPYSGCTLDWTYALLILMSILRVHLDVLLSYS